MESIDKNYYQEGISKSVNCKFCLFKGKAIASHYANNHPKDEVVISRMSPEAAIEAIKDSKFLYSPNEQETLDSNTFKCRICYIEFKKFLVFFDHMALHTGELRHQCCKCGYRTSTRSGIIKHCISAHIGNNASCKILYKEPSDKRYFWGYLCKKCNFFQINEDNVKRHIEKTHKSQDYSNVIKINFSKLPTTPDFCIGSNKMMDSKNTGTSSEFQNVLKNDHGGRALKSISSEKIIVGNEITMVQAPKNETEIFAECSGENISCCYEPGNNIDNSKTSVDKVTLETNNGSILVGNGQTEVNNQEIPNLFDSKCENGNDASSSEHSEGLELDEAVSENECELAGCFEFSPGLDNYPQFIEAEIVNSYKQKCAEAVAVISNNKTKSVNLEFIQKLASKQQSEESNSTKIYTLENVTIGKLTKKKLPFDKKEADKQANDHVSEKNNVETCGNNVEARNLPTRRQLPDRTCKGIIKLKVNDGDTDLSIVEENFIQDFHNLDTQENETESIMSKKETFHLQNFSNENVSMLFENQVQRCKQILTEKTSYEPKIQCYVSSQPPNSNVSEFTHVMRQISQLQPKFTALTDISVGDLKVTKDSNGLFFLCLIKLFSRPCEFRTPSLETFGHHINVCHHMAHWDGSCGSCFAVFIQDKSTSDKSAINTQNRAFCHLVRAHLNQRSVNIAGKASIKKVCEEQTPKPMLRVRRLSGDKLSTPRADKEDSLIHRVNQDSVTHDAQNTEHHLSSNECLASSDTDVIPGVSNSEASLTSPPTGMVHWSLLENLYDSDSTHKPCEQTPNDKNNQYFLSTMAGTFKTLAVYKKMLSHKRLRNLYKCMGAKCSFTTCSSKEFAVHFDHHKEIQLSNPGEDPHKGYWKMCPYCFFSYTTSRDFTIHIRKEHGDCLVQCRYCFYRAKSIVNVHLHHTVEHEDYMDFGALECEQTEVNLPPFIERQFTDFVLAIRCNTDSCNLITYMTDKFGNHLVTAHSKNLSCHICESCFTNVVALLEHYKEFHGISLYQCIYCVYGASTEHDMRMHLCYKHPNSLAKAIHRTDVGSVQTPGATNREKLRRLIFFKDDYLLLKFIVPLPTRKDPDITTLLSHDTAQLLTTEVARPECDGDQSNIEQVQFGSVSPVKKAVDSRQVIIKPNPSPGKRINTGRLSDSHPNKVYLLNADVSKAPKGGVNLNDLPSEVSPTKTSLKCSSNRNIGISTDIWWTRKFYSRCKDSLLQICPKPTDVTDHSRRVSTLIPTISSITSTVTSSHIVASDKTLTNISSPDMENYSDSMQLSQESSEELMIEHYFKCGNPGCIFETNTSSSLRNHLVICAYACQSQKLMCVYCKRTFKYTSSLIGHLRTHGPKRYSCGVCQFQASLPTRVSSHMKTVHHINNTDMNPVESLKEDHERDYFVLTPKQNQDPVSNKINVKGRKRKRNRRQTRFNPEELDKIPKAAIFPSPLGCTLCIYETKVRSNLIRHISQHVTSTIVSQEEIVNPVPNKPEKMFDKMMNLAGSSHKKKSIQDEKELEVDCKYKYVPDQSRYMCHLKECGYRTLSESMLRDHVKVIHKEEPFYKCPHCSEENAAIPIDQLGLHLKLHDSPLFRCMYCDHYSHIRRSIERHQALTHSNELVSVQVIRMNKPDQQPSGECIIKHPSADQPDEQVVLGEEWWFCCNICSFKTKKKKMMLSHGFEEHQFSKPFKCSVCNYENATDSGINTHVKNYHPDKESCEVIALYKKVTEVKKPVLEPIQPLWRRDAKRIKLIRGITLDEKGDAPPPVVTGVSTNVDVDMLELKFGSFGRPVLGAFFLCPLCHKFKVKNRDEMREHLYNHHNYKPFTCMICELSLTKKPAIHLHEFHKIALEEDMSGFYETNINQGLEDWVDKVLTTQEKFMREFSIEKVPAVLSNRKRKRSADMKQDNPDVSAEKKRVLEFSSQPSTSSPTLNASRESNTAIPGASNDYPESTVKERKKKERRSLTHRYRCNYCQLTANKKNCIILHIKKVHKNMPLCIVTKSQITNKADAFMCTYCKCLSLDLISLKKHWTDTHKVSEPSFAYDKTNIYFNADYECFWCKRKGGLGFLGNHCKMEHPDQYFLLISVKYKCSECKIVFSTVNMLKNHFSTSHPFKIFCNEDNTQKLVSSSENTETSKKLEQILMYQCFTCHFISSKFSPMIKHVLRHFITYACTECDGLYITASGIRNHVYRRHSGSNMKPVILKGSDKDIENAKRNIIVFPEFGEKRKISEEELSQAENAEKIHEQSLDCYNDPLAVTVNPSNVEEIYQKSPGFLEYSDTSCTQLQKLTRKQIRASRKATRKNNSLNSMFITVSSHGKKIKLLAETMQKLTDVNANLSLNDYSLLKT